MKTPATVELKYPGKQVVAAPDGVAQVDAPVAVHYEQAPLETVYPALQVSGTGPVVQADAPVGHG